MTLWQSRFSLLGCALTVPGWGEAGGGGGGGGGGGLGMGASLLPSTRKFFNSVCRKIVS